MEFVKCHFKASSIRMIVGFSLIWAWIDSTLVGVPLARSISQNTLLGDLTSMVSVLSYMAVYCLCFFLPKLSELTRSRCVQWAAAGTASLGTVLSSLSSYLPAELVVGGLVFVGIGMGALILMWADEYAFVASNDGYILVAGSIALSFIFYLVAVESSDWMRILMSTLFPLASCILLSSQASLPVSPKTSRVLLFRDVADNETSTKITRIMGFSPDAAAWFLSFGLVYGIMGDYSASPDLLDSTLMNFQQGGRSLAAIIFFIGLKALSWKPHTVYRASLSVVLVGLVLVPLVGPMAKFVTGFIAHMAYGLFECVTWALVFEIMSDRRADAGAVAGPARLLSSAGILLGTLAVFLAKDVIFATDLQLQSILSSSICILVMTTTMVLDTNNDSNIWSIIKASAVRGAAANDMDFGSKLHSSVQMICESHGLTERETQILLLLAQGRSSPYISQQLLIGVNTVNTHKRRIYQKLDVHGKQELIDLVTLSSPSE